MVPDRTTDAIPERTSDQRRRGSSTLVNALIGAAAGVVLSFVPFSTVLGGAIAGYLERGTTEDGLKVGAIAGLVMFVPFILFAYFVGAILVFGNAPGFFAGFLVVVLLFAAVYTVGAAMLGGFLGVYLRKELKQGQSGRW